MSEEKRYSVNHAANGCLASFVFSLAASLILLGAIFIWPQLDSSELGRTMQLVIWLASLVFGGYVAARKGKTTGWTNALVVGCFALLYLLFRWPKLPDRGPLGSLLNLLSEPHWSQLAAVGLTIPAALLGGYLWVLRTNSQSD